MSARMFSLLNGNCRPCPLHRHTFAIYAHSIQSSTKQDNMQNTLAIRVL